MAEIRPDLARFAENEREDGGIRGDRDAQFSSVFQIGFASCFNIRGALTERIVISAQGYRTGEAVAPHKKVFEIGDAAVVADGLHIAGLEAGIEDKFPVGGHEPVHAQGMFVEIDIAAEKGPAQLVGQSHLRSRGREFGAVEAVAGEDLGDAAAGERPFLGHNPVGVGSDVIAVEIGEGGFVEAIDPVAAEKVVRPAQVAAEAQRKAPALLLVAIIGGIAFGVVEGDPGQGRGVAQPGFGEADVERAVIAPEVPVGAEALAVAEEVGHGQADRADELVDFRIAGRHVGGVGRFLLDLEFEVDLLLVDGFDVGLDVTEIVEHPDLALAAFEQGAAEGVAREDLELAADHFFLGAGVAGDVDLVDAGLFAFADRKIDVEHVAVARNLGGLDLRVDIAAVIIEGADALLQGFVQLFLAVDLALGKAEIGGQKLGRKDGVALPGDVAEGVLLPLVNPELDEHVTLVGAVIEGIAEDFSIAVAVIEIEIDELALILGVFHLVEIGAAPPAVLFGPLELLAQFFVGEAGIAMEIYFFDLDLAALVEDKAHEHAAGVGTADVLVGLDFGEQIALFLVLVIELALGAADQGGAHHLAGIEIENALDIVLLELFVALDLHLL
ncbi:MAG: hypothetical protein BWY77_00367 [bacterium ADurb.Bin431]|nr:MAG: hypothetical protein BWY77_00367 [bacterium ADurb.Bin431]